MPEKDAIVGLEHGTVRLASYSAAWNILFEKEKKTLLDAMKGRVLAVEHIGSTAIPDMEAKPIIDVAAMVGSPDDIRSCIQPLASAGYEYKGEYGLPGRHFFVKGCPHTHYLHVVAKGSGHWPAWLAFRDYLAAHPETAAEYSKLKRGLANKHGADRDSYTKAKGDFISKTVERAGAEGFRTDRVCQDQVSRNDKSNV